MKNKTISTWVDQVVKSLQDREERIRLFKEWDTVFQYKWNAAPPPWDAVFEYKWHIMPTPNEGMAEEKGSSHDAA